MRASFAPVGVAYCADGRRVGFTAPLHLGLRVGGLVVIEGAGGDADLVVQVREQQVVNREAMSVELDPDDDALGPGVAAATVRPMFRSVLGVGAPVARIVGGVAETATSAGPFGERRLRAATTDEARSVVDALDAGTATIEIGAIVAAEPATTTVPARLRTKGFARHTFMCGQSGSGKTSTTGVLFERLLSGSSLPLVVIDPNSDYIHLGTTADPTDDSDAAQRHRALAAGVAVARTRGSPSTYTLCADFGELGLDLQAELLRLDPIADLELFATLRALTEGHSSATIWDVAQWAAAQPESAPLAARIVNLGIDRWTVWRRDDEVSISQVDLPAHRCVVLDVGSLPSPQERSAVALALLRTRWARRADRRPVLIAVDEAHNVFPAAPPDAIAAAATEVGILIAGEGRKYGLHLFVATQRPAKVHANVVSQCDNLILMRMNGEDDVADLQASFSHVPPAMVGEALGFSLGQALVAGPIAPVPRIVQIGARVTAEGGGDVSTEWAAPPP